MKVNKKNSSLSTNHQRSISGSTREKENTISLYATNGSIVQEFIHRQENYIEDKIERRQAALNKYGFIAALIDGFNSDGSKRLEINLSEMADFSINQNGGFSIFFWFLCKKQKEGIHRFIIKKGNTDEELTPAIGILPNGSNLFIKMNSSKNKVENLFSNKKIEMNRMYGLLATFSIDYHNDLTDISLYLDGFLDSQVTVPGQPVHNQGNLFIGKCDNINQGFAGCVADVILIPRVMTEEEISSLHQSCLNNFKVNRIFQSYEIFSEKFEKDYLVEKYMFYTGNPLYVIENLKLSNIDLKEIVKNYDDELRREMEAQVKIEEIISEEEKIVNKLKNYLGDYDTDISVTFKKLATNSGFIYTVLFLVNEMQDELSPKRIQNVCEILNETLHLNTDEKMIFYLSKIMNALSQNDTMVKLYTFFKNLKYYTANIFPEFKSNLDLSYYGSNSKSNFGNTITNNLFNEAKSVELHENLLISSQNFKNYLDDVDIEKELGKSNFSIKSLYTRTKSARPYTARGYYSERTDDADMVNQQFEDIGENNNELVEVEEEKEEDRVYTITEKEDLNKEIIKDGSHVEIEVNEKICNENHAEIKNYGGNEEFKQKDGNLMSNDYEAKDHEINGNANNDNTDENLIREIPEEQKVNENNETNSDNIMHAKSLKEKEENTHVLENAKHNNESSYNVNFNKTKFSGINVKDEKPYNNCTNNNNGESGMQSNNDDIISNFENKMLIKTSGSDTHKFSDVDNMIPMDNFGSSSEMNANENREENFNMSSDLTPKFSSDWSLGQFELIIDHCYDCHLHKLSTRHYEYVMINII